MRNGLGIVRRMCVIRRGWRTGPALRSIGRMPIVGLGREDDLRTDHSSGYMVEGDEVKVRRIESGRERVRV